MNWAFVDYENIGTLENLTASDYDRIYVFCGPKNTRVKIGAPPFDRFCRIELIGASTTGSNNLDFILAFHLGRFHEVADKSVTFHIISNDGGFNGLVNHLKKIGRSCKKMVTKVANPPKAVTKATSPKETPPSLSEEASLVVSRLKQLDGRKRPRKREKFLNWIKSQCQGLPNSALPEAVYKELVNGKLVLEAGADISYELTR